MNVGTKPERPTARSLVAHAIPRDAGPAEIALSIDKAFALLLVGLGRWVGEDSARVLLERSLEDVRVAHPWISGVRAASKAGRCLSGLDERLNGLDSAELVETMEDLLASLIGLLAKFIGNDLALRIVVRGWPAGPPAAKEGESR